MIKIQKTGNRRKFKCDKGINKKHIDNIIIKSERIIKKNSPKIRNKIALLTSTSAV